MKLLVDTLLMWLPPMLYYCRGAAVFLSTNGQSLHPRPKKEEAAHQRFSDANFRIEKGKVSIFFSVCRVNDCILRVNNVDCRDIDRSTLIHTLKTSTSTVNLLVKRRRVGKRYSTTLNLNGSYHGISLELGAYVAKIQPGSVAAKEGSIAVGDRIVGVRIINNCVYRVSNQVIPNLLVHPVPSMLWLIVLLPHLPPINLGMTLIPCLTTLTFLWW